VRRLTTEEYKIRLIEINNKNNTNIKLKDGVEYINGVTNITHICTCGKEWDVNPNHVLSSNSTSCGLCYTFEQWCINNNHQDMLDRWDYELNTYKPSGITFASNKKYYFKCSRGLHKSELKSIVNFTNGQDGSIKCNQCNSFAQWGIDNICSNFLEKYWDYEKNTIDPWQISCGSNSKKVWIICQEKDYHGSYDIYCSSFVSGSRCGYCKGDRIVHPKDSFGQYLIDTYGENALDLYWDYNKNIKNPFSIKIKSSTQRVYIYCQEKDYHGSYRMTCSDFVRGFRCPYCCSIKVHPLDSLGKLLDDKDLLHLWSDKNKRSPYEYSLGSTSKKVWWKCPNNKHIDYKRNIYESVRANFRCPTCSNGQRESIMANTLKQVLKYEYPNTEWEYDAGFRTSKNIISKYDIYIPEINYLIECQSEYHDNRQKMDKLKKEYAMNNNYNFIAIDKRDYTPLQAIQLFLPNIKEMPNYVDITKDTTRKWDLEEAQQLLDKGYTYQETADIIGTARYNIQGHVSRGILNKPKNYKKKSTKNIKIVCLNKKDNELLKVYNSLNEASLDIKGNKKRAGNICVALKDNKKSAFGYKWMYYNDYINKKGVNIS